MALDTPEGGVGIPPRVSAPFATVSGMRILHTSDWHLGRRLHGVDLTAAHRAFLDWLHALVEERAIDAVVVAGDVYDRAIPHPDALGLWEHAVTGILDRWVRIIASSGNHDSFVRLGLNRHHLDRAGVHLRTHLSDLTAGVRLDVDGALVDPDDDSPAVSIHGIPYLEPALVWERMGADRRTHAAVLTTAMDRITAHRDAHAPRDRLVVLAHAFVAGAASSESERDVSLGGVGVVPASVFDAADYAALGHLHRPQAITDRVRFSGSPLPFSFGEARTDKSVLEVEFTLSVDGTASPPAVTVHPVPHFRPVRTLTGTVEEVLKQAPQQPADALIAADLTDPQRVPGAVDRLRTAFPGFIRMTWTSLAQPAAASAEGSRGDDETRSDADVFADFHRLQRGGPPPAHAAHRFAAALSAVRTQDAGGVG